MNLENLSFSVHTTNLLFRKGLKTAEDLVPVLSSPEKREELRNYLGERGYQEIMDEMPVEDDITDWDITDLPDLPDLPEQGVSVLPADYTKALKLNQHIKAHAQIAQESLYEVCKGLKEMRDGKLYKELDYQNFEEYCEKEVGLTRQHVYRYLSIAENLSEDFVTSMLQIGTTKLSLLAMLEPEQREEIIQTVDVESVTVKELKSEISTLKQNNQQLKDKQKQAESRISELESENQDKQDKIISLERQNEELENQPRDTVFENDPETLEEIERLKAQNESLTEQNTELELKIWDYENQEQAVSDAEEKRFAEFTSNMNQQLVEERQRLKKESQEEIQRANLQRDNAFLEVEKLKKQLAEQKEDSPEMKRFKVRIATLCDSIEQLVKFLCEHADSAFIDKSETVIKGAETSLSEIRKQVQA